MLTLNHGDHGIELPHESIIIIQNATEEDYWKLANEDLKIEFDGSCLYIHSPAKYEHEKLLMKLLFRIDQYLQKHPEKGDVIGSRFALKLPNGMRPEPDIVILPPNSVNPKDSVFEGVPLLIIEILSPSNRNHDLGVKHDWYKDAGVPKIWFIDIDEQECQQFTNKNGYQSESCGLDVLYTDELFAMIFEE